MDYSKYIKKWHLPDSFAPPVVLTYEDLKACPLSRSDVKEDLEAVNSSIKVIQETRGGSWPESELSEDFDLLDLAWHEREFRDKLSFAYVIYDKADHYIGCFYLYPMGNRTELTEALISYDVDASWWVTTGAKEKGYYEKFTKLCSYGLLKISLLATSIIPIRLCQHRPEANSRKALLRP